MSCICIHVNVFIVTITINWRPQVAADSGSLYLTIADAIAADLSTGRLTPGDRLPPQRELADRLGVALGTVTRGYTEAERRGLVRGHGRRGTIISDGGRGRSGLSSLVDTGGLIDLSANHPAASINPDLGSALKSLARRSDLGLLLEYPSPEGYRSIGRRPPFGWAPRG